jgi:hypothetical protein
MPGRRPRTSCLPAASATHEVVPVVAVFDLMMSVAEDRPSLSPLGARGATVRAPLCEPRPHLADAMVEARHHASFGRCRDATRAKRTAARPYWRKSSLLHHRVGRTAAVSVRLERHGTAPRQRTAPVLAGPLRRGRDIEDADPDGPCARARRASSGTRSTWWRVSRRGGPPSRSPSRSRPERSSGCLSAPATLLSAGRPPGARAGRCRTARPASRRGTPCRSSGCRAGSARRRSPRPQ